MNPAEKLFLERYIGNPGRNLLRFSFVFMVLGIVLSVGILTAALNLFEGYERSLKSALLDSFPHISIKADYEDYLDADMVSRDLTILSSQPEVASATGVLSSSLMSHNGSRALGSLITAYDWPAGASPSYAKYVKQGAAKPSPGEAVIGRYLARELGLSLGDTLRVTYPRMDLITPLGLFPADHAFRVAGLYSSGYYEYDRSLVICHIDDARRVLSLPQSYSAIEVKLDSRYIDSADRLAVKFDRLISPDLSAFPVVNTGLLDIVKMQKWLIFIIFSFLVLIAGINVISAVSTLIYDRKNEIAVMKTLGASARIIKHILNYQMATICLASIVLGQLFGLLLSWLAVKQNFYSLKGDVYFIDKLTLYVSPLNQLVIFLVAAALVILCIRFPLRRIDRMQIIELLRNP